jgi:hypothetical protein
LPEASSSLRDGGGFAALVRTAAPDRHVPPARIAAIFAEDSGDILLLHGNNATN